MLSNLSFTPGQVLGALFVGLLAITGLILLSRRHFELKSREDLRAKYKDRQWASPLTARNKYPDVNIFQWQPVFFKIGVILALGVSFGVFNLTSAPQGTSDGGFQLSIDEDVEIEVPRSQEAPPPPPPPPPAIQEVAMVEALDETEDIKFVDQSVDANSAIAASLSQTRDRNTPPPPPPPPPARVDDAREIFVVVEEMPRFPGCEDFPGDQKAKKACADAKLMEFIYSNIHYPAVARENGVEGNVVVQFVVNTDGSATDLKIVRDIGGGCGEEALRVVELMNVLKDKWVPGKQRGRPVRVMFTLPIRFKLQYN
ncbi:MAG: energy transducer TonB [Saprospiraceae bacterium]|jgi:protein TonB